VQTKAELLAEKARKAKEARSSGHVEAFVQQSKEERLQAAPKAKVSAFAALSQRTSKVPAKTTPPAQESLISTAPRINSVQADSPKHLKASFQENDFEDQTYSAEPDDDLPSFDSLPLASPLTDHSTQSGQASTIEEAATQPSTDRPNPFSKFISIDDSDGYEDSHWSDEDTPSKSEPTPGVSTGPLNRNSSFVRPAQAGDRATGSAINRPPAFGVKYQPSAPGAVSRPPPASPPGAATPKTNSFSALAQRTSPERKPSTPTVEELRAQSLRNKISGEVFTPKNQVAPAVVKKDPPWSDVNIPAGSHYSAQEWAAARGEANNVVFEIRNAGQGMLMSLKRTPKGSTTRVYDAAPAKPSKPAKGQKSAPVVLGYKDEYTPPTSEEMQGCLNPLFESTWDGCLLLAPSAKTSHPESISSSMEMINDDPVFKGQVYRIVRPESQRSTVPWLFGMSGTFEISALGAPLKTPLDVQAPLAESYAPGYSPSAAADALGSALLGIDPNANSLIEQEIEDEAAPEFMTPKG
jgi:hypothetical protein